MLELEFRLLNNVQGTYINETNCQNLEALNLDEVPEERKSSLYWLTYTNHHGEVVQTEKKCWIEHFKVDAESGSGKTDVNYSLRIDEPPSYLLRDWLDSDVFIELHCSQPKFEFKILEENQEPLKDVVIDETDGLPKIEQKVIGVSSFGLVLVPLTKFVCLGALLGDAFGHFKVDQKGGTPSR